MYDIDHTIATLESLKAMGLSIALGQHTKDDLFRYIALFYLLVHLALA